jgi:hypothetical protein
LIEGVFIGQAISRALSLFAIIGPSTASIESPKKMVSSGDVQGKIYKFKSNSECSDLGVPTPDLPDKVRGHMVLVLSTVPGKLNFVKVMTVSAYFKRLNGLLLTPYSSPRG